MRRKQERERRKTVRDGEREVREGEVKERRKRGGRGVLGVGGR